MIRSKIAVKFLVPAILASACGPDATPPPSGPQQAWIDSPQTGITVQVGETVLWQWRAASFTQVDRFDLSDCNSDDVWWGGIKANEQVGEGGSLGNMYTGNWYTVMTSAGECDFRTRAKDAADSYSPWSSPVHLSIVEPMGRPSATIELDILSPHEGQSMPLDSLTVVSYRATSPQQVAYFLYQDCQTEPGELEVELIPGLNLDPPADNTYTGSHSIVPTEAGPCTARVRAVVDNALTDPTGERVFDLSQWAEVSFFFGPSLVQVTPGVPAMLPTPTPTPGSGSFQATAKMTANCRAGPGTAHNEWGYAREGEIVEAVGRNEDGTWLQVGNPHASGRCWLSIIALDVPFDVSLLPVAPYPTPPPSEEGGEPPTGCLVTSNATGQLMCVAPCPPRAIPGTACTP